jgi:acyl transferase domain-containing protein
LVAAAGVAGLIKTALALKHKKIPPSLNFETPNPEIDFANSPFYVNTKLGMADKRCCTTSGCQFFGVGGTNVLYSTRRSPRVRTIRTFLTQNSYCSQQNQYGFRESNSQSEGTPAENQQINLADLSYTLQRGRKAFNHRRLVVCGDTADAIQALETLDPNRVTTRQTELRDPAVVFMFPGQGSQYVNMGLNLYSHEPVFRSAVEQCASILKPLLGRDLREVMYPADGDIETATLSLRQTIFTQSALFTIEYALAQLWQSWGVKPYAMIGHSIGEFVAACLAGVFSRGWAEAGCN